MGLARLGDLHGCGANIKPETALTGQVTLTHVTTGSYDANTHQR